ncbi:MAG: hypothetical protein Q9188_004189 [Gyalolechia gomerana]
MPEHAGDGDRLTTLTNHQASWKIQAPAQLRAAAPVPPVVIALIAATAADKKVLLENEGLQAPSLLLLVRNVGERGKSKIHKESLLAEIANLRRDNTRLQTLNEEVSSAASDLQERAQGLQDSHDWQKIVLDTIGRNGHDREIIKRLRCGETPQVIAGWLTQQHPIQPHMHRVPGGTHGLIEIVTAFEESLRSDDGYRLSKESDTLQIGWTSVSSSQTLLGHLFDLYFTWVHPTHMLFSETDFRESYETNDETYCSSALVNAICAMACHLMDQKDTDGEGDIETLGTGFMNQARQGVQPQNYMTLCSVQALAVMYLAELSSGKARSATGYLRASVEFLKVAELDGQSPKAREISLWGIQTLNTSSTGITYQKLYAPELPHMPEFRHVELFSNHAVWRFYRFNGDQRKLPVRPSHAILTACHQAALFQIIHESLNLYCGLRGAATAEAVLTLYRRYRDWEEDLPFILKAVDEEAQPLPHILYLHVQYHVAVLQHLTPMLQSGLFEGSNLQELQRMVVRHAQQGIEIMEHARRLYSARYLMPLLSFCVIHIGDALIRYSPHEPPDSDVVEFCLGLLQQASGGFAICGPLQELYRRTAYECGVQLPANIETITGQLGNYGMDDILDACTRLDYKQPVDQSVRHIADNVAKEWPSTWEQVVNSPGRPSTVKKLSTGERPLRIKSLLND